MGFRRGAGQTNEGIDELSEGSEAQENEIKQRSTPHTLRVYSITSDLVFQESGAMSEEKEEKNDSMEIHTLQRKLELAGRKLELAGSRNVELERNLELAGRKLELAGSRNVELEQRVREMARFENAQRARVDARLTAARPTEPQSSAAPTVFANFVYDNRSQSRAAQRGDRTQDSPSTKICSPAQSANSGLGIFEAVD